MKRTAQPAEKPVAKPVARPGARRAPSFLAQYRLLLAKDLRHEFKTRSMLADMGFYAVLVLVVLGVASSQDADSGSVSQLAGGLVWVVIVFSALLGLSRSFSHEREAAALEGVMLAPIDRSVVYLAKLSANLVFLAIVEVVVLPLFWLFLLGGAPLSATFPFTIAAIAAGTVGVSAAGTMLATLAMRARAGEVLLAILFIPLALPLLYSCVAATGAAFAGADGWMDAFVPAMVLMCAYDVVMVLVSWVLYDFALDGG